MACPPTLEPTDWEYPCNLHPSDAFEPLDEDAFRVKTNQLFIKGIEDGDRTPCLQDDLPVLKLPNRFGVKLPPVERGNVRTTSTCQSDTLFRVTENGQVGYVNPKQRSGFNIRDLVPSDDYIQITLGRGSLASLLWPGLSRNEEYIQIWVEHDTQGRVVMRCKNIRPRTPDRGKGKRFERLLQEHYDGSVEYHNAQVLVIPARSDGHNIDGDDIDRDIHVICDAEVDGTYNGHIAEVKWSSPPKVEDKDQTFSALLRLYIQCRTNGSAVAVLGTASRWGGVRISIKSLDEMEEDLKECFSSIRSEHLRYSMKECVANLHALLSSLRQFVSKERVGASFLLCRAFSDSEGSHAESHDLRLYRIRSQSEGST